MNVHVPTPVEVGSVRGSQALTRLLAYDDVHRVLDVGSGVGEHARIMRAAGRHVTTISLDPPADFVEDYCQGRSTRAGDYDAIWASHVLEHQPNVGRFLRLCFRDLRDDGVLAVTVPPAKHGIVGGHLTTWNAGLLVYNLIIAGFDCREARVSEVYSSGPGYPPYNISVIVRKRAADLPLLRMDAGDIQRLAAFFPVPIAQGFDGRFPAIGW